MPVVGPLANEQKLIGETYDLALGYDPGNGNITMYGYVCAPGSQFLEATNLQDEEHLVQIASPLSTDRYGRFPKVSQGDWSGGERQLIFVTGNQYYSSTQCDTSKSGHLTCLGKYTTSTITSIPTTQQRALTSDGVYYWSGNGTGTVQVKQLGGAVTQRTDANSGVELLRGPDGMYAACVGQMVRLSLNSVYGFTQATNDTTASLTNNGQAWMAVFNNTLYYVTGANARLINSVTYPLPGAAPGTLVYTVPQMGYQILALGDGANGLVFATGAPQGLTSDIWTFDGATATFIGTVVGTVIDLKTSNGVTYILVNAHDGESLQGGFPVIYQLSGSSISLLDDYRMVDPAFQPVNLIALTGRLDSDGVYLHLFWPGLNVKRYRIGTNAIYDVGNPTAGGAVNNHIGAVGAAGGFCEAIPNGTTLYQCRPEDPPNQNGVLTTSFYDWTTPTVFKSFKSVEFTMNSALDPTAITVQYRLDTSSAALTPLTVVLSPSGNSLIAYFPTRTIGHRVQLQITLIAAKTPDIAGLSILATLARTWTVTVACRRNQVARSSDQPDPQQATGQALLANLQNAYLLAAGNVTLWIPDPTVAQTPGGNGAMASVNAQLQDYQRTINAAAGAGLHRVADGTLDFEGDVKLILTEVL